MALTVISVTVWGCSRGAPAVGWRIDGGAEFQQLGRRDRDHWRRTDRAVYPALHGHTVRVASGTPSTLQLTAIVGSGLQVAAASWSSNRTDLATVTPAGLVSAAGPAGGPVIITAAYGGATATATLHIVVTQTVLAPAGPAADQARRVTVAESVRFELLQLAAAAWSRDLSAR